MVYCSLAAKRTDRTSASGSAQHGLASLWKTGGVLSDFSPRGAEEGCLSSSPSTLALGRSGRRTCGLRRKQNTHTNSPVKSFLSVVRFRLSLVVLAVCWVFSHQVSLPPCQEWRLKNSRILPPHLEVSSLRERLLIYRTRGQQCYAVPAADVASPGHRLDHHIISFLQLEGTT